MALAYHADPKAVEGSTLERSASRAKMKKEQKLQSELAKKSEVVLRRHKRNQLMWDTDSSPSIVSTDSHTSSGSDNTPRHSALFVLPLEGEQGGQSGGKRSNDVEVGVASSNGRRREDAEADCVTAL